MTVMLKIVIILLRVYDSVFLSSQTVAIIISCNYFNFIIRNRLKIYAYKNLLAIDVILFCSAYEDNKKLKTRLYLGESSIAYSME